jgi:Two component regulator propeller
MKILSSIIFILFFSVFGFSQTNLSWKSYAAYNEIKDLSESNNLVYAASENAIFSKNLTTAAITKTTTVDGLSGETITKIYNSKTFNKTLVGYENGLIIVIDNKDGSMFNAVGIIQKQIPSNLKRVNHFMENNGIVYIACDFGIVQFYLNNSEFGDTYFLGATISDYQKVLQTTVYNNAIYAVTQNNGIKTANLSNPNLNDFSQWTVFNPNSWNGIATLNNTLIASNMDNNLYKFNGSVPSIFYGAGQPNLDFRVNENFLIATTAAKVIVFSSNLLITTQIDNTSILPITPVFTCGTFINGVTFIGTKENGVYTKSNTATFENITPNCPIRNVIFNLKSFPTGFYAVYGGYSGDYNPYSYTNPGGLNQFGFSKYKDDFWKNIPATGVLGAKALTRIAINPKNENQIYISSFFSGVLKVENDVATTLFNQTNSSLESLDISPPNPSYIDIRINGSAFDKSGNVWFTNSRIKNAIKRLKTDNTWQAVSIAPISANSVAGYLGNDYGNLVVDKNNTKWLSSTQDGVIGYNETGNVFKKISYGLGNGNLPSTDVRVIAIDNKNQLWIGTTSGLRVLPSVDNFNSASQLNANSIIILENGIAQELFYDQFITDIVVDGSNRKWVATNNQGVFLVSSNGQSTIYHFTTDNSPLPSNSVLDLEINGTTGEVFMASNKGMVSFKGIATTASNSLENAFVYPNPVRPEFNGTVKISGLLDKTNVKITDIEGGLVFETTSEGGTIEWDTTAFGKYKVASGVYMIFLSGSDGEETKVKKVMIVR